MFLVDHVVEKMVDPIVDALITCTVRQFGYVFHCNQNIQKFREEVKKLEDVKTGLEKRIAEASDNVEDPTKEVSEWLNKVESLLREIQGNRLLQGEGNVRCLDVCSRYKRGKEGKTKMPDVTKLREECNFSIVTHRSRPAATWQRTYTMNYENVQSRDSLFKQIMEALKDDQIYKIGIYGMPGVGKTRMMEEVAQQARKEGLFHDIGMTVVSENPNLKDVQQKLAESLNLNLDKETEGARKELLHKRMKNGKKILVMVDDIWNDRIKLEDIGIPAADDHTPGCKVVLTSRIKDVCQDLGVIDPFQIEFLLKEEAWSLFEKKVGDFVNLPEMRSIAKKVCEECGGLPLAILAIGGALKHKKSKEAWQDALHQLINSRADNIGERTAGVYSRIKLSYNYLDPSEARSIFILCCLFPEDADIPIDDLVMYAFAKKLLLGMNKMDKARNRVHTLINTLKTHSLLLEGKSDKFVKMHDVIRDVGISIASKNEEDMFLVKPNVGEWPEEKEYIHCRTISLQLNEDFVFPDELKCPELRNLRLEGNGIRSSDKSNIFNGMEKLEVLHLSRVRISTLPSSLKHLRMLCLYNCGSVNLAFLKELEKLEILRIDCQKELAPEIKFLTHLRLLDLRKCYNLKIIPSGVISSLTQLEELHIPGGFDEWEKNGNASLDELKSLRHLTSLELYVPNGNMLLPLDELQCKHLIRFNVAIGSRLNWRDPSDEVPSSATKVLKLVGIPLRTEIIILMEKAEVLFLEKLKGLKDVFHNKEFLDLKHLKVNDCDGVEHLFGNPKSISQIKGLCASGSLSKLSELKVYNCQIRYLFSTAVAGSLPQLQKLIIGDCEMLEEIMSDDEELMFISFHRLKNLVLMRLPNLRGFFVDMKKMSTMSCNTTSLTHPALFNNKVRFPALEILKIADLESLTAIWDNHSFLGSEAHDSFRQLKSVTVTGCDKLVNVIPPNVAPSFQNLGELQVKSCDSVKSVVEVAALEEGSNEILMFPQLKNLKLEKLQKLQTFCYSSSSGSMEEEGSGKTFVFPQLNDLALEELPMLRSLCCSIRGGEEIVVVEEEEEEGNIPQPQQLFNHKVRFPALEILEIKNLKSLTAIWDNQSFLDSEAHDSFHQLKSVKVTFCRRIVNVIPPNVVPWFQNNLRELKVKSCDSVVSIVEVAAFEEGNDKILMFPQLNTLKLEKLQNLKTFCYSSSGGSMEEEGSGKTFVFPELNDLALGYLPMLRSFCCSRRVGEEIVVVEEEQEEGNIPQPQQLFNHKVHFPILTQLRCEESIFEGVWLDHLLTRFFGKIRSLGVKNDNSLVNASSLLQQFEVAEEFTMEDCSSVEVIFNLDGLDKERQTTVFSQIKKLKLYDIPKLERIWMKEPKGLLVFHNLTYLEVSRCNKLSYLFSLSIARCLTQLRELEIYRCSDMEEIVRSEGQGEEDDMDQIVFPQLQNLWLLHLENLTCFSRRTNAFNFPSLNNVVLLGCPKLETFTFGRISTPVITSLRINDLWRNYDKMEEDVTDHLNKKVQEILKEIPEDKREGKR